MKLKKTILDGKMIWKTSLKDRNFWIDRDSSPQSILIFFFFKVKINFYFFNLIIRDWLYID